MPGLRLPDREITDRGQSIYCNQLKGLLEEDNRGKFVAIDVETADYEVADQTIDAMVRLLERVPDAQIWVERIGYAVSFHA